MALLAASCSESAKCSVGFDGRSVECTKSNSFSDFVESIDGSMWILIAIGVVALIAWIVEQAGPNAGGGVGTTGSPQPRPQMVAAMALNAGDRIEAEPGPVTIEHIAWVGQQATPQLLGRR
ncbi:hypothetical protein [Dermatobacter hominis]|uniref:hypothetical protein n=1 Tax=Dermatobacter hominis TaxID=2884263 RepID=UPI001D12D53F|nr:hypothetical protein [Dermatobacter hominis]UDY35836.1 hypothetical protein LH044_21275 [Dermatobacter hominis]